MQKSQFFAIFDFERPVDFIRMSKSVHKFTFSESPISSLSGDTKKNKIWSNWELSGKQLKCWKSENGQLYIVQKPDPYINQMIHADLDKHNSIFFSVLYIH